MAKLDDPNAKKVPPLESLRVDQHHFTVRGIRKWFAALIDRVHAKSEATKLTPLGFEAPILGASVPNRTLTSIINDRGLYFRDMDMHFVYTLVTVEGVDLSQYFERLPLAGLVELQAALDTEKKKEDISWFILNALLARIQYYCQNRDKAKKEHPFDDVVHDIEAKVGLRLNAARLGEYMASVSRQCRRAEDTIDTNEALRALGLIS